MNFISFPSQLYRLLQMLEDKDMTDIASWQPHGRAFLVRDKTAFVNKVMPSWFRQTKYTSFQRQLNIYGFKRITNGPDQHAYYHEYFLRGEYASTLKIERIALKGTGTRLPTDHENEPNFYQMPFKVDARHTNERVAIDQDNTRDTTALAVPLTMQSRGINFDRKADFAIIPGLVPRHSFHSCATAMPTTGGSLWNNSQECFSANTSAYGCPSTKIRGWSAPVNSKQASDSLIGAQYRPSTESTVAAILREQALIEAIQEALRLHH